MAEQNFESLIIEGSKRLVDMVIKLADGGIDDCELETLKTWIESFSAAIEYEQAKREEAYQAAQSHPADKNRAEKI